MWLFKRKKTDRKSQQRGPLCSHCKSTNTGIVRYHGGDHADYIKTWRGQRYVTCRCFDCGQDFYTEEPEGGIPDEAVKDNALIDNEDELQAAENELRRQVEEDDDRRFG